jgi:hypothetical protein
MKSTFFCILDKTTYLSIFKVIIMKKYVLFALLLLPLLANADEVKINGLWYNLNEDNYTAEVINSQDGISYSGSIVIPETVISNNKTYTVTRIGYNAFCDCTSLTSVVMPETITSIAQGGFARCSNLNSINKSDGVNHLPNGITSIGWVAFEGCGITTITLPSSLNYIDGRVFSECPLTSIYIPVNITNIHPEAFRGCPYITSIKVSPLNEYYDSRNDCNAIIETSTDVLNTGCENTIIPAGVKEIAGDAFCGRVGLTSINIPSSVKIIKEPSQYLGTFGGCSKLERVDITDLEAWCDIAFGNEDSNPLRTAGKLYLNGSRITALTIPESVTKIKDYAFEGGKFTSVSIPNTITKIGKGAFKGCSTLRTASINNAEETGCALTEIEKDAFCDCSSLQSINFTKYPSVIGEAAFARCNSLTSIELNDGLTEILSHTFQTCENLTSINIPKNLTSIGDEAFCNCTNLSIDLTLPEGLTTIGNRAFASCSSIETLSLPNTLTTIDDEAFHGARGLRSIYIPSSVTKIGEMGFVELSNALSIIVDGDNTKYDSRNNCNAIIETKTGKLLAGCRNTIIPDGVTSIEKKALAWTPNTIFIVPNSVETLRQNAFGWCGKLRTLVFGSGVTDIDRAINYGTGGWPGDTYCYATSVPITDGNAFYDCGPAGTLHVPTESIEDYRTTAPWSQFPDIVPITGEEVFPVDLFLNNSYGNSVMLNHHDGKKAIAHLERTLHKNGKWNTLCLPFDLSASEIANSSFAGADIRTLSSASFANGTLTLNFTPAVGDDPDNPAAGSVTSIKAGTPYLIKWADTGESIENPDFANVTVDKTQRDKVCDLGGGMSITFTGTYDPVSIDEEGDNTKIYLGAGNKLYWPNAKMNIGCQRAYFQLSGFIADDPSASGVKEFKLNFGEEDATFIRNTQFGTQNDDAWYDLNGRRLSGNPTQKGVYINSGKKVVIK